MPDKRPRTYLAPSAYREAHCNWTWGGAIVGASLPVGLKFMCDGTVDELSVGWGVAAMLAFAIGYFVGGVIFESAYCTEDD